MSDDSADRLLREYLDAENDSDSEEPLTRILEKFAQPIVRRIVASSLRGPAAQDADDVVSDTIVHLVRRLVDLRADPSARPIRDLLGYIATSAYNNCHERLRERYPARNRLRNQLHYLLNHHPDFALWRTAQGQSACGYRRWIGQSPGSVERLGDMDFAVAGPAQKRAQIVALVGEVFRRAGAPLDLESLIEVIARSIHLEEQRIEPLSGISELATAAAVDSQLELRMSLRQLWDDIGQLPQRQRTALLFSLRDLQGREILSFLPLTRTATITEIAEALQIPLMKLASLWGELPLDDVAIGELLGASRQQVIKLRRLARERLRRGSKRREQTVTTRSHQNVEPDSPSSKSGNDLTTKLGGTTSR